MTEPSHLASRFSLRLAYNGGINAAALVTGLAILAEVVIARRMRVRMALAAWCSGSLADNL